MCHRSFSTPSPGSRFWPRAALGLCCIMLLAAGAFFLGHNSRPDDDGGEPLRYFRAVYLLRSMGGPAAAEKENVPSRVVFDDETESLLHHPDKIQVLQRIADDLAASGTDRARARLYEAYARLGLGDKQTAAALLMGHVVDSDYNAEHYALLCRTLHDIEDYVTLLIICREWEERDPSCREDRIRYTYAALFNLGRYGDAETCMLESRRCLGWQSGVYAARAAFAGGEEGRAETILEHAAREYSADRERMYRLWDRLRSLTRM